jgi:FMN phosphatase YigB (HAD superfamily)
MKKVYLLFLLTILPLLASAETVEINGIRYNVDPELKTAVVTSSNQPKMEAVYKSHPEFKTLFDAILTSEDFER